MKRIHEIGILTVFTALTVINTVVVSSQTATTAAPAQPATQTESQRKWIKSLADASNRKNGGMKHRGGIVSTVNGRNVVTYPRAQPAAIR